MRSRFFMDIGVAAFGGILSYFFLQAAPFSLTGEEVMHQNGFVPESLQPNFDENIPNECIIQSVRGISYWKNTRHPSFNTLLRKEYLTKNSDGRYIPSPVDRVYPLENGDRPLTEDDFLKLKQLLIVDANKTYGFYPAVYREPTHYQRFNITNRQRDKVLSDLKQLAQQDDKVGFLVRHTLLTMIEGDIKVDLTYHFQDTQDFLEKIADIDLEQLCLNDADIQGSLTYGRAKKWLNTAFVDLRTIEMLSRDAADYKYYLSKALFEEVMHVKAGPLLFNRWGFLGINGASLLAEEVMMAYYGQDFDPGDYDDNPTRRLIEAHVNRSTSPSYRENADMANRIAAGWSAIFILIILTIIESVSLKRRTSNRSEE